MFVVAHRRAGKTVALANTLIAAALDNPRTTPPPRYAYIGPSFDQTKDLVLDLSEAIHRQPFPASAPSKANSPCIFSSGASIRLYGGGLAYERLRGIYLDGAVLDEYPLLAPQVLHLGGSPRAGGLPGFRHRLGHLATATITSTKLKLRAEDDPDWDIFDIPITATKEDALSYDEVAKMRRT